MCVEIIFLLEKICRSYIYFRWTYFVFSKYLRDLNLLFFNFSFGNMVFWQLSCFRITFYCHFLQSEFKGNMSYWQVVTSEIHRAMFCYEALFWLNGYVHKQNSCILCEELAERLQELPMDPYKCTVWYGFSKSTKADTWRWMASQTVISNY